MQNFEKTLREVTKMDGALTSCLMKWEKGGSTILNSSTNRSLLDHSNRSLKERSLRERSTHAEGGLIAVGSKAAAGSSGSSSGGRRAQDHSSGGPGQKGRIDCSDSDRFIGTRLNVDTEWGYGRLYVDGQLGGSDSATASNSGQCEDAPGVQTAEEVRQEEYARAINTAVNAPPADHKIVGCRDAKPNVNPQKVLFEVIAASADGASKKKTAPDRFIASSPERVLDAPAIVDDYYLNLIHWSNHNQLATALASWVYVWNADTGDIMELMGCQQDTEYVSSVQWIETGPVVAVGTSFGVVQLWDAAAQKCVRTMRTGEAERRVGSLAWNAHILSSGNSSGVIRHHDVRVPRHEVGRLEGAHAQEVCGLAWSPNHSQLASGGNDNSVKIWSSVQDQVPTHTLSHQAAVKPLAWCPWKAHLLATGGGSTDRTIRLWNTLLGREAREPVDTGSQVSGLVWNAEYKELCSSHGYAEHQLTLWKYPMLTKIADLKGHSQRILCLSGSPDGQFVASAGADETLRIWKCFASSAIKSNSKSKTGTFSGGAPTPLVNSKTFPRGGGIR